MIDIEYNNLGFMSDAAYSAHFYLIVQKYEGQFIGAEKVIVEIEETPYYSLQSKKASWLVISDDRKEITIKFSAHKYYDTKGKVTSIPSAEMVLGDLHNLMKRAAERFTSKEI